MTEAALGVQAELMPEHTFRTYHLGQWVEQAAGWLPPGAWAACPVAPPPPDGAEVVISVDGTYKRTLSIVGAGLDGAVFHVWTAEAPSDEAVERYLDACLGKWQVLELVHPKRIRTRLFDELRRQGLPVQPWGGGAELEASSANELYRAILDGRLVQDGDGLLAEHVGNVAARTAVDGTLRLVRPEDGRLCDAAFAMRAAWWRALELSRMSGPLAIY
jgi:hypothetical protein